MADERKRKRKKKKNKKRKSKALLQSSPTATVSLSRVSPLPSPAFTSGSKKRIVSSSPSPSPSPSPASTFAFEETIDDFTHHLLTVNPGEDMVKVMQKFNRHYKHRNIYIMSASGTASKVELDGSPDPLQYEGQLKLLSLSVERTLSFGVNDDSQKTLLASLSTNNGTVVGGTLVGQFIAASFIHIIVGTSKRTTGESSTANQNMNLASEDVGAVPENVSANRNISSTFEDVVAGTDDQTMQQHETDPDNAHTDECGDIRKKYLIF